MSPFSLLYAAATGIRNRLYDRAILKERRLSGPVISVGSISVGGAGKTPFVILLGELLKARNFPFDVLSRGYGRRSRGALVVDVNGSAEEFGDEPLLIARRLGCPVVVGENRCVAGKLAEHEFGPQMHILDDGFQHRQLTRDFDIVLLTSADLKDRLLPEGRLREPFSSLCRGDAIVLVDGLKPENLPVASSKIWRVCRGVAIENPPERPLIFCGIARPNAFMKQLQARGIHPVASKFFRDHHRYSQRDVHELMDLREKNEADGFITTEKDSINLGPLLSELGRVAVARVTMQLDDPDAALDTLLRVVAERRTPA